MTSFRTVATDTIMNWDKKFLNSTALADFIRLRSQLRDSMELEKPLMRNARSEGQMKAAYFIPVHPNSRLNTPYDYTTRIVVAQSTPYNGHIILFDPPNSLIHGELTVALQYIS